VAWSTQGNIRIGQAPVNWSARSLESPTAHYIPILRYKRDYPWPG